MKTEIKVVVEGLAVGMFVSRLDRPWMETPFLVQGFDIKSRDDIEALREHCNYVYVDVDKGITPDSHYLVKDETSRSEGKEAHVRHYTKSELTHLKNNVGARPGNPEYKISAEFESELENAKQIYTDLKGVLKQLITDLKQGKALNLVPVKQVIAVMTESIIRNPAAMMWVISLKKINDNDYTRPLGNSAWCTTFGRHLNLGQASIEALALGGLLLDIGKVRQSEELLQKSGVLSASEKHQMEMHVYLGVKLLEESMKSSSEGMIPIDVVNMVATHHERADGSGYPQGLLNEKIPLFGRIAGIVDSYDAMTSQSMHVNGEPMTPHEAITELYELRKSKYQPELIEEFIKAVGLYPTGSLVELSTGEVGAVVAVNGPGRLRPSMVLLLDKGKEVLSRFAPMDLSQASRDISVSRGLAFGAFGIDMDKLFQ